MNKKLKLMTAVVAAGLITTACGNTNGRTDTTDGPSDSAQVTQAESGKESETTAPVTIVQSEESGEESKGAESSKDSKGFYGDWKVTKRAGESKIYALSEEEISSFIGTTFTYGDGVYKNGSDEIEITSYEEGLETADQFYSDFSIQLTDIGIEKDSVPTVSLEAKSNFFGANIYVKDKDTLVILYEGVFFEAVRDAQTVRLGQSSDQTKTEGGMASKAKEYILNGQEDKPEAGKWNWSQSFLDQVNIEQVYEKYISAGGSAEDIESFVKYLSENAPVPKNWKTLFEADLLNSYGEKPSKYELLENDLYQVYVKKDGAEVPFVVVNAKTGYYHG